MNTSSAYGSITLGGEGWDKKSIEEANKLFEFIEGTCIGISLDEKFSTDTDDISPKVKFHGQGIHSFSENLKSFDSWIKDFTNYPLEIKRYKDLVRCMSKSELFFKFEFTDYEDGMEFIYEKRGLLEPHEGVLSWVETWYEDFSHKYKSYDEYREKVCNLILEHTDLKVEYDGLYNDISPTLIWELEKVFRLNHKEFAKYTSAQRSVCKGCTERSDQTCTFCPVTRTYRKYAEYFCAPKKSGAEKKWDICLLKFFDHADKICKECEKESNQDCLICKVYLIREEIDSGLPF